MCLLTCVTWTPCWHVIVESDSTQMVPFCTQEIVANDSAEILSYEWRSENIKPDTGRLYIDDDMRMNSKYIGESQTIHMIHVTQTCHMVSSVVQCHTDVSYSVIHTWHIRSSFTDMSYSVIQTCHTVSYRHYTLQNCYFCLNVMLLHS